MHGFSRSGCLHGASRAPNTCCSATTGDAARVPVEWLRDARSKRFSGERDSVKLMTYKSSKGLQFPVVVVAGVGSLPWRDPAGDARELHVAMTRATERLLITASRASEFVRRLQPLCRPLATSGAWFPAARIESDARGRLLRANG